MDEAYHGHTLTTAKAEWRYGVLATKSRESISIQRRSNSLLTRRHHAPRSSVPVITVRQVKGKGKADTKTKEVGVQVLGVNHRITTPKYRFQLLQTEPVSDRVKGVTLR